MRDLLNSIWDVVEGSIGTCPRCMRAAFVAAFSATIIATGITFSTAVSGAMLILVWAPPVSLGLLWLAHAWMFSQRTVAHGSTAARESNSAQETLPRRHFLALFGRSLAFSALAGALPSIATATATCRCANPSDKCCYNYDGTTYVCAPSSASCCAHATSPWFCSSPRPNCNGDGSSNPRCR
jgi:hypothetical protein